MTVDLLIEATLPSREQSTSSGKRCNTTPFSGGCRPTPPNWRSEYGCDPGSADNARNPTSPTAITASIFTASATGAFTSSSQRFAYDTTNGALQYSATGSNSSESLVATLTGAPAVTASDLLSEH